jgi:hypothetical protein
MKRLAVALAAVTVGAIFAPMALPQADRTLYASAFPGNDVGTKVSNAMAACKPNPGSTCIIVIDDSLSAYVLGTMPIMCSQCSLIDYRAGAQTLTRVKAMAATLANGTVSNDSNGSWLLQAPPNLDALLGASGIGDWHARITPNTTTATTFISPGNVTITVGSTIGFSSNFGTALTIGNPYDTTTNEVVSTGNWSVVDGTHFHILATKPHAPPYTVSQQGGAILEEDSIYQSNRAYTGGLVWYQRVIGPGTYNVLGSGYENGSAYAGVHYFRNCIPALETTCDFYPRIYGYLNGPLLFYGSEGGTGANGLIKFTTNDADDPTGTNALIWMNPRNGYDYAAAFQASQYFFTGAGKGVSGPAGLSQALMDDASGGGWNLSVANAATQGFRFWKNGAGSILLAKLDPTGNYSANSFTGAATATFAAGVGAGTSPGIPTCASSKTCDSLGGTVVLTMGTPPQQPAFC